MLKPFFTYYGGKYRAAPHYPKPQYSTIVEPFAGSAGYSLRYHEARVVLVERDPILAAVWRFIIGATASDFATLPDLRAGESVDDLSVCQEAKWLIGFWLNKGAASPCKTPSAWMRSGIRPNSYWGRAVRERLVTQAGRVRHWRVIEGSYDDAVVGDVVPGAATWFVDPPYERAGRLYRYPTVDYGHLARWCNARPGQVIVCENSGANWLPFAPFRAIKSTPGSRGKGSSSEVIWCATNSADAPARRLK